MTVCLLVSYLDDMSTSALAPIDTPVDAVIGRNVDYLIWQSRQTKAALAARMGITGGALGHKLRGRRPWAAAELQFVATHFRVSIDSLFRELPDLDSNQEPAGIVTALPIRASEDESIQTEDLAIVTPIRSIVAS